MWVAKQEFQNYQAKIRRNGKFTDNDQYCLAAALFEWGWSCITDALISRCRNKAAVALLDGNIPDAEIWIARSRAIKEIE